MHHFICLSDQIEKRSTEIKIKNTTSSTLTSLNFYTHLSQFNIHIHTNRLQSNTPISQILQQVINCNILNMKQQTFEQRRIVQLSKQLDAERDKYAKLARDSGFINSRLKQAHQELQQNKEKVIEYQINNHRLNQNIKELQRQNQRLRQEIEKEQEMRSEADVENVRQRQHIEQLKQEMLDYQGKTKAILYERTNQIADRDRQIYKLKEQNLQIEKIYINQRQKLQKQQNKHLRDLTKLIQSFEALKKEVKQFKTHYQKLIQSERAKFKQQMEETIQRIEQLERRLRREQQWQKQIEQLKARLQDVVIQNSQKIIQLYKYKYAK